MVPRASISTFVQTHKELIVQSLPEHLSSRRFVRVLLTEMARTPKLQACTPESVLGGTLTAAALGLEIGVNGESYLVPYGGVAQLIIGYQGMVKLFYQNPLAQSLDAQAVYPGDEFDFRFGTDPYITHTPKFPRDGEPFAYYAVGTLTTGATHFVVLSPDDIRRLRGDRKGDVADPEHWMERKTVLRQVLKLLPRSAQLNAAVAVDERSGTDLWDARAARQIARDGVLAELPAATGDIIEGDTTEGA
jgi:recombination protein RecT